MTYGWSIEIAVLFWKQAFVDNFKLNLIFLNSLIKKERFYFIGKLLHLKIWKGGFISTDQPLTKTEIFEIAFQTGGI